MDYNSYTTRKALKDAINKCLLRGHHPVCTLKSKGDNVPDVEVQVVSVKATKHYCEIEYIELRSENYGKENISHNEIVELVCDLCDA